MDEPFSPITQNYQEPAGLDSLHEYLQRHQPILPYMVVNNIPPFRHEIQLSKHKIQYDPQQGLLSINGLRFDLSKVRTLNGGDAVGAKHDWMQAKYYKQDGTELMGMVLSPGPCNGRSCRTNYYVAYDFLHKTVSCWEGNGGPEFDLYRLSGETSMDYLFIRMDEVFDGPEEEPLLITDYHLYSLNKGLFVRQGTDSTNPYFIRRTESMKDGSKRKVFTEAKWFEVIR